MRSTTSYLCKKLEKIHQDNTLEMLYQNHTKDNFISISRYDDFEIFEDYHCVEEQLKNNLSVSGLVVKLASTIYGVIVKKIGHSIFMK